LHNETAAKDRVDLAVAHGPNLIVSIVPKKYPYDCAVRRAPSMFRQVDAGATGAADQLSGVPGIRKSERSYEQSNNKRMFTHAASSVCCHQPI
jgi:hypothetical protein